MSEMETMKRWVAAIAAVAAWGVSVFFSTKGFGFEAPGYEWLGLVLAGLVTVLQLLFNSRPPNMTLYYAGVLSYVYSISTNFIGILYAVGGERFVADIAAHPLHHLGVLVVVSGAAFMLDMVPEPLFVYGLFGRDAAAESDPIGAAFSGVPRVPRPRTVPRGRRAH